MSTDGDATFREDTDGTSGGPPFSAEKLAWIDRLIAAHQTNLPGTGAGDGAFDYPPTSSSHSGELIVCS